MRIKYDIYNGRPYCNTELWAPPKAEDNARVVFSERPDRIADVIFFRGYPKCCRIRLYGPDLHIVADLFADAAFHPINQIIPGFWDELVADTLRRGGILPEEREQA